VEEEEKPFGRIYEVGRLHVRSIVTSCVASRSERTVRSGHHRLSGVTRRTVISLANLYCLELTLADTPYLCTWVVRLLMYRCTRCNRFLAVLDI
jgi:hypothetical protein